MSDDDSVARYQRPPRKGQFKSGQSGNPRGRPKGSRNIRTYVRRLLDAPILVNENGKTRRMPRGEAIAIQLVNMAAKGDPKGLAAVITLTRDCEFGHRGRPAERAFARRRPGCDGGRHRSHSRCGSRPFSARGARVATLELSRGG